MNREYYLNYLRISIVALVVYLFNPFSTAFATTQEEIVQGCTELAEWTALVVSHRKELTMEQTLQVTEQYIQQYQLSEGTADNLRLAVKYVYKNPDIVDEVLLREYLVGCINFYTNELNPDGRPDV